MTIATQNQKIYTWQFWWLSVSVFLFFTSFNMIVPELPAYLTSLGGEEYKGLIISIFTITAGLSRPFSGKLADTIGRRPVLLIGLIVSFGSILIYPFITNVVAFFVLRFVHGFSTGFAPTGSSAMVADIVPIERRGEAMGIFGLCTSVGMSLGAYLGSEIALLTSIKTMFYLSACIGLVSILMILRIKETLPNRIAFSPVLLQISANEVIEPGVWLPSLVLFCYIFSYGVVITTSPDMSSYLGITNKGAYFSFSILASLLVRAFSGQISDRHGRSPVLKFSLSMLLIAMLLYGFAETVWQFYASSILFGLGIGLSSPAVTAWVVDLSQEHAKGKAIATMFIALEIGIGLGAFISGELHDNRIENFPIVGIVSAAIQLVGIILLFTFGKTNDIIQQKHEKK